MTAPIPIAARRGMTAARKLAACLAHMTHPETGEPLVPGAGHMTEAEIIAYVQFDHERPLAMGGRDHAANIRPLPIVDHAEKTKADMKAIAKARRIDNWRATGRYHKRKARPIKSRGFRKDVKQKIPSRPFQKRRADERAKT